MEELTKIEKDLQIVRNALQVIIFEFSVQTQDYDFEQGNDPGTNLIHIAEDLKEISAWCAKHREELQEEK